jgi:hypothetical protein
MPPEPSSGPRSTAWEGTSSVTTFTGWSGRSALCSSCWPCSSSLRGSSSCAATKSAWRTRRNGPCPAHWTSLSREGNIQGNPAAPNQQCEATGKHDATCWRLTSPATPAILRGVGRSPGHTIPQMASVWRLSAGPRRLEGLGQGERLQTLSVTASLRAEHMSGERRSCLPRPPKQSLEQPVSLSSSQQE